MNKFLKIIKVLVNTLTTTILLLGSIFIFAYIIGIEPYVVETGSMEPNIKRGSLSFINKHADYNSIEENDIIAFSLPTGKKATHRVIRKTERGLETQGDSNSSPDGVITTKSNFVGKNILSIPKIGYFVMFIQTKKGKIIMVTMIMILLILPFLFVDDKKRKKCKH